MLQEPDNEPQDTLFDQLGLEEDERKKYEPLLKYFTNLNIGDVETFDQDDLEYAALPEHKLLMMRFAQRVKEIFK